MNTIWKLTLLGTLWAVASVVAAETDPAPAPKGDAASPSFRVAVFELQADKKANIDSGALTDRVVTICSAIDGVTLVDRAELTRVANEQKLSLSGMTDTNSSVKVGRFVAATHILVGRLSTIGQSYYLILKVVDVETTEQKVISVRTSIAEDMDKLFETLDRDIAVALTPRKITKDDTAGIEGLRKAASWLRGKSVVIDIKETHVSRPLPDPASALTAFNLLRELDVNAILPNSPPAGWKESVLASGKYGDAKVDYLLEGEGISSFAAELQGMTSCRARIELRLVPVPGREVLFAKAGVGAEVDLVEELAAKAALEEATREALDALIKSGSKQFGGEGS